MRISLSRFLQLRFNVFLYRRLNWECVYLYTILLGKLYFFFHRRERQDIEMAVENTFARKKSSTEIKYVTRNVVQGILFHYYEKLFNAFSTVETLKSFLRQNIKSEGLEAIKRGLSKGRGVLLVTGHFEGVEFIPGYLSSKNFPVTIIVKFSSNHLRNVSTKKAAEFATKIIDVDNTPNTLKAILNCLKENHVVITQCDEIDEWRASRHDKILFLGKQIKLDKTINILLNRGGASIVFGAMHRQEKRKYQFIVHSYKEMSRSVGSSIHLSGGAIALKFLEQDILKYPEGWYQWEKYSNIIRMSSMPGTKAEIQRAPSLVEPSLSRIS